MHGGTNGRHRQRSHGVDEVVRHRRSVGLPVGLPVGLLVVLALLVAGLAAGGSTSSALSAPVPNQRYIDPIFDVAVTSDHVYTTATTCEGVDVDLALDVYEPVGDTAAQRPLYVWIHGGSFAIGDKADPLEVVTSTDFARRGYVAVSIDYRLCNSLTGEAITDAYEDAKAAVTWLRAHAAQFRIDPTRVAVGGASAGAITALGVGYQPDRSAGQGTDADPAHADAVLSMAGAWLPGVVEAGEPPLFMAHGTSDPIIPFAKAQEMCAGAVAATVPCEFHSYDAGHETLVAFLPDIELAAFAWLYGALELAALPAEPPPPTTSTSTTTPVPPAVVPVVVNPPLTG